MDKAKQYGFVGILICISFILGKYSTPSTTETSRTTSNLHQTAETKTAENKLVHESEVRAKDGTIKITRVIEYRKAEQNTSSTKLQTSSEVRKETKNLPDYQITGGYLLRSPNENQRYSLGLSMRVFGSLYVGVDTTTDLKEQRVFLTLGF